MDIKQQQNAKPIRVALVEISKKSKEQVIYCIPQ